MRKVFEKIKEEVKAVIPPTIYFFVALHVIALERSLLTRGTGIGPISHVKITIAALILGKAVLIADHLPIINRYPSKPLIFNVAWKTAIYMIVASVIHYLENLVDFWRTTGSIAAANQKLWAQIVWAHFLGIQILLFILVWSYCTMHELARVAGRERILEIFFGIRPKPPAGHSMAKPVGGVT
jgi:hypothetical protein